MIQDDPGTFSVRLADSVNHTKYPVVILTTDHQIKTGEIVPLRVDQLVVFCPPQRESFNKLRKKQQKHTNTIKNWKPCTQHITGIAGASAKMSGMVTVAVWSL